MLFRLILLLCVAICAQAKNGFGGTNQEWGIKEFKHGASLFWWLYYADPSEKPANFDVYSKPLIIWLSGGPGESASGVGNFLGIGPLDATGKTRKDSLVNDYNVLFIDAPVGAGFSYTTSESAFNRDEKDIAQGITYCLNDIFKKFPKFRNVPLYIVGEGYGGKVAAVLAWHLNQISEIIGDNLRGIVLGNPAIASIDSFKSSTSDLKEFMNNKVAPVLNLAKNYGSQEHLVAGYLKETISKPATDIVEKLVTQTDIKVAICIGEHDSVIPASSTLAWINKAFGNNAKWQNSPKRPLIIDGSTQGYQKHLTGWDGRTYQFSLYEISNAGHSVAQDNLSVLRAILKEVTF